MKSAFGVVLLIALCIPIVVMLARSPIGRRFGHRAHSGLPADLAPDTELADVRRRLDLLEGDVEILQHALREAREQAEYLQEIFEQTRRTDHAPGAG